MRRFRRVGVALALATALTAGGVTMNVHAASVTAASCSASQTRLCDLVTRSIEYLEDLKPSPLRDALLARLRSLQTRYCTSC